MLYLYYLLKYALIKHEIERLTEKILDIPTGGGGNIFVGEKGMLWADYGAWKLFPESDFVGYKPPQPTIADSPGHHKEWIAACKGGEPALCNFNYAGPLTEAVLLGCVATRVRRKLLWDGPNMKIIDDPEANRFRSRAMREPWTI
jgi:hypothetical protein